MSKASKRLLSLVVALVMVLTLGCGSAFAAGPDTYSMIDNFDITTLDYLYNNKSSNGDYTSNFIEGLLTQDPHGTLIPGIIAREIDRQGIRDALLAITAVTAATALLALAAGYPLL